MRLIKAFLVFLTLSGFGAAHAMDIVLQWDANTEPDLAGYKIYYDVDSGAPYGGVGATSGNSPIVLTLAEDQNPDPAVVEYKVLGVPDTDHYFVVTAYDNFGRESGYSNEVLAISGAPAPPTNLLITAIDQIIGALMDIKQYLAARTP